MKKGFTLIELLGVVALLGVLILVAMPSLLSSNKAANENAKKDFSNTVSAACESYATVNANGKAKTLFEGTEKSITVPVRDLIEQNFLKSDLENPSTKTTIYNENKTITITSAGGLIKCTY